MLAGGVSDPNSPANKLTDKRYANFVSAFNFAQYGDQATSRDAVLKDTPILYTAESALGLIKPNADYIKAETAYYLANVSKLHSDRRSDGRQAAAELCALVAYGLDPATEKQGSVRSVLEGGIGDPDSPANKLTDKRYAGLRHGLQLRPIWREGHDHHNAAQQPIVDKYMRQTLEENAGKDNEGVRLALYFERKAPTHHLFYEVLADPALAKVVRTLSVAARFLCHRRRRQAGEAVREQARHRGLLRPRGAGQVHDALHQPVGGQQPDVDSRRACDSVLFAQPADGRHLDRPA